MSRRGRQITRLRAQHAAEIARLTAAMRRQAHDWQTERRRLLAEKTAADRAIDRLQQQLADATYDTATHALIDAADEEWRTSEPKPFPAVEEPW